MIKVVLLAVQVSAKKRAVHYLEGYPTGSVVWEAAAQCLGQDKTLGMSSGAEKRFWCETWWRTLAAKSSEQQNRRWARICDDVEAGAAMTRPWRNAQRWKSCWSKQYVARIHDASVTLTRDGRGPPGNAIVTNRSHTFPVHLNNLPETRAKVKAFTVPIATSFGALSVHAAHLINQMPRLATVAAHVPSNCLILVLDTRLHREFVELFHSAGILRKAQVHFVSTSGPLQTFHAPTVYFAGEAVKVSKGTKRPLTHLDSNSSSFDWYTLEEEVCSWQLTTNRTALRSRLDSLEHDNTTKFEALIVSR